MVVLIPSQMTLPAVLMRNLMENMTFYFAHLGVQIPLSIVASIGVCHIPDRGSIPREGAFLHSQRVSKIQIIVHFLVERQRRILSYSILLI